MQQVTRKKLGEGVSLTCITTPKFKRAVLRVMLLLPLGGPDSALRACLPQVLRRGTAALPDLRALGEALDAFESSQLMYEALGDHIHSFFLRKKRDEWAKYSAAVTDWEIRHYLGNS